MLFQKQWSLCMDVYICVCIHEGTHVWGEQGSTFSVFLSLSSSFVCFIFCFSFCLFFEQSITKPKLPNPGKMAV